jgi:hypothetical protein
MIRNLSLLIFAVTAFVIIIGCSGANSNSVTPQLPKDSLSDIVVNVDPSDTNRIFLGSWDVTLDPGTMTALINSSRSADAHFSVRGLLPNPGLGINSWDPIGQIIDVDVTITNPFALNAYDLRLIIYTDTIGHELVNADSWTSLYDIGGGQTVNPFKAYAKTQPGRIFAAHQSHKENVRIKCPSGNFNIQFAIDASYPSNCEEPYEISNFTQGELMSDMGASADCLVTVLDWQANANSVTLNLPEITGMGLVSFTQKDTNTWQLNLVNATGASAGIYSGFILAKSSDSGMLALYNKVSVTVTESLFHGWAKHWGEFSSDFGNAIGTDKNGDLWVAGDFSGQLVDFNPGSGVYNLSSYGKSDAFLNKFDDEGNFLFATNWGASGEDTALGLAFDIVGSLYACGKFQGTVDFDPGVGETVYEAAGEFGKNDIYVSRLNSNTGDFIFAKAWGSIQDDSAMDCASDNSGNVYVVGYFQDSADFNPDSGTTTLTSLGGTDSFISKFSSAGVFQWARSWGGDQPLTIETAETIVLDGSNNAYVVGEFEGTVDFKPGTTKDERTALGSRDLYMCKYSWTGGYLWVKAWGGSTASDEDMGNDIAYDGSAKIYVIGEFGGTVDFNPHIDLVEEKTSVGQKDVFLSCFDLDGNFLWVKTWGGSLNDYGSSVDIDTEGNICVTGAFRSLNIDFDPGPGSTIIASKGDRDIYVSKFNPEGSFMWVKTFGSTGLDQGLGIITDTNDMIYTTGNFSGTIDFNPTSGIDNHSAFGMQDVFILKLKPGGNW